MSRPAADLLIVERARLDRWDAGAPAPTRSRCAAAASLACGPDAELGALAGPQRPRASTRAAARSRPACATRTSILVPWARARAELDLRRLRRDRGLGVRPRGAIISPRSRAPVRWSAAAGTRTAGASARTARRSTPSTGARPVLLHSHDFHALWVNGAALRAAGDHARHAGSRGRADRARRRRASRPACVREHAVRAFRALEDRHRGGRRPPRCSTRRGRGAARPRRHGGARLRAPRARVSLHASASRAAAAAARARCTCADPTASTGAPRWTSRAATATTRSAIGAVKLFADGTLGSRTAALLEPYDGHGGARHRPADARRRWREPRARALRRASRSRSTPSAIAPCATRSTRSSAGARPAGSRALRRCRRASSTCSSSSADDLPRFAALGRRRQHAAARTASRTLALALEHWGARCRTAYPWRALLDGRRAARVRLRRAGRAAGARRLGLRGRRARGSHRAAVAFVPDQRVTLDEALRAYTEGAARLAGQWPRARLAAVREPGRPGGVGSRPARLGPAAGCTTRGHRAR